MDFFLIKNSQLHPSAFRSVISAIGKTELIKLMFTMDYYIQVSSNRTEQNKNYRVIVTTESSMF